MVTSTDSGVSSGEFFDPVMEKYDKRSHMRWILSHITAYKGMLVAFVILSTVSIAITTINPILMVNILVNERIASNWSQVRLFAFIILGLTILNGLVGFANSIVIELTSQKVERDDNEDAST